jgi:hypothetical protein
LSTVKFLFTPFAGPAAKLKFYETYIACVSGAIFCALIFYYLSEKLMKHAHIRRVRLNTEALANNETRKLKRNFTRINKLIVKTKQKLGIYGIALYAPFFLSVPLGSIVAAKFYRKDKRTFPLIVVGMVINGAITTSLSYLVQGKF